MNAFLKRICEIGEAGGGHGSRQRSRGEETFTPVQVPGSAVLKNEPPAALVLKGIKALEHERALGVLYACANRGAEALASVGGLFQLQPECVCDFTSVARRPLLAAY